MVSMRIVTGGSMMVPNARQAQFAPVVAARCPALRVNVEMGDDVSMATVSSISVLKGMFA
jgi:hypothetical protein